MDDFKAVSARFKRAAEADETAQHVVDHAESLALRGKMIGVLLLDARRQAGRSLDDCARLLHVSSEQVERWEFGDDVPTLPQLELLAYFLGVPVSHFWSMDTLEATADDLVSAQVEYVALRNRMIGALLRIAREESDISLEALSAASGVAAEQITRYEQGEAAVPMHELTVLSNGLKKNVSYFLESGSHLGDWLAMREEWKHFTHLPPDVRRFAANPLNIGFLEIAIMFSQMPADRLRRVGESVLNISL